MLLSQQVTGLKVDEKLFNALLSKLDIIHFTTLKAYASGCWKPPRIHVHQGGKQCDAARRFIM